MRPTIFAFMLMALHPRVLDDLSYLLKVCCISAIVHEANFIDDFFAKVATASILCPLSSILFALHFILCFFDYLGEFARLDLAFIDHVEAMMLYLVMKFDVFSSV